MIVNGFCLNLLLFIFCSADKIMLINCLMSQILTFSSYRVQLQNTVINTKLTRVEIKNAIVAEKKKTQEIIQK